MKIIIATGGSGGHIFPALEVACELKSERHEVCFVGAFKDFKKKIDALGFPAREISAQGFSSRSFLKKIQSIGLMLKAVIESMGILQLLKPDCGLGFGGYGAFPVVFSAGLLGYKTMIHEQNVIPGRANRVLNFVAKKIAVGFKESVSHFNLKKTVVTGCPIRPLSHTIDKKAILRNFGLHENKVTFLVLGGSQGSHKINQVFCASVREIKERLDIQVIHITGQYDYDTVKEQSQTLGVPYYVTSFMDNVYDAYAVADLAVSRAGAVTVTELAAFKIPAIMIPYPYAGGHQIFNAKVLAKSQPAVIINEEDLDHKHFAGIVLKAHDEFSKMAQSNEASDSIYNPLAARQIANEVIHL